MLRVLLWLGLEQDENEWARSVSKGEVAVFAETYENQVFVPVINIWGTKLMPRPKWSDSKGKIKQTMDMFDPVPPGWEWSGDWQIRPELSVEFEPDAMMNEFTDEVYEHYTRRPMSSWPEDSKEATWCDIVSAHKHTHLIHTVSVSPHLCPSARRRADGARGEAEEEGYNGND